MTKHWTFKEGSAFSIGIMLIGLLLQLCIGPVKWSLAAWPVNFILLLIYIIGLIAMYAFRKKAYLFLWMMQYTAAVPAIGIGALATMIYGITNWEGTLSLWSFVLLYLWITTILGLTTLKQFARLIKQLTNPKLVPVTFLSSPRGYRSLSDASELDEEEHCWEGASFSFDAAKLRTLPHITMDFHALKVQL